MLIEYGEQETAGEARARYLKGMMAVRRVTTEQLAMMTEIKPRTLERYLSGRSDIAKAPGLSVALISYILSMNAYALGGAEPIKPGTIFMSDGRPVVVKKYNLALHTEKAALDSFKWSMEHNGYDVITLSEKAGVRKRVIQDIVSYRTNLLRMQACSLYPICKTMMFHPYFLYGLYGMERYNNYVKNQKERQELRKVIAEAKQKFYQERNGQ